MNTRLLVAMAALTVVQAVHAADGKHLFILAGQCNMANLDHNDTFMPVIYQKIGTAELIIVKDAEAGAPIYRWYKKWRSATGEPAPIAKPGDLYDRLMKQVRTLTDNQNIQTITFVWMQGEQDAEQEYGRVYAASLTGLIAQLREDLECEDINVVVGRINDYGLFAHKRGTPRHAQWVLVRDAQVAVVEACARGAWVDTDDLNSGMDRTGTAVENDFHLTPDGYRTLGQRLAEKALALLEN